MKSSGFPKFFNSCFASNRRDHDVEITLGWGTESIYLTSGSYTDTLCDSKEVT